MWCLYNKKTGKVVTDFRKGQPPWHLIEKKTKDIAGIGGIHWDNIDVFYIDDEKANIDKPNSIKEKGLTVKDNKITIDGKTFSKEYGDRDFILMSNSDISKLVETTDVKVLLEQILIRLRNIMRRMY
ncbi:MAG: hypothetical protein JRI44_11710 [Deltaproteobacteria bacterium]|nr:hypothetical protein [Deltaproteobacteria bacterium]